MARTIRRNYLGKRVKDKDKGKKGCGWEYWGKGNLFIRRVFWKHRNKGKVWRKVINRLRRREEREVISEQLV